MKTGKTNETAPPAAGDQLRDLLRDKGLRTTKPRLLVLQALEKIGQPAKVDQVREKAGLPDSQMVSVYRTLELFCDLGIAQRLHLENGTQLFSLRDACCGETHTHHHHALCRVCGKMVPLPLEMDALCRQAEAAAATLGFHHISHTFEIYGVCADCEK